ncbi:MAG: hypothetical protein J5988_11370 [Eubacterium sp.]|nr:hypothetical protein [Eubacterium sp.]
MSDEKFEILKANSKGIRMIYIVDVLNGGSNGRYPEALMKVQHRQGYCLLLDVEDASYSNAMMYAAFYAQDNDGLWKEVRISAGRLCDYVIADNGQVLYKDKSLSTLLEKQTAAFEKSMQVEKMRREEEKKRRSEEQKRLQEEDECRRIELQKKQKEAERKRKQRLEEVRLRREKEEAERQAEMKHRDEDFKRNMEANFSQQQTQVRDSAGNRWIKCEFCGLKAKESEFASYVVVGII